LIPRPRIAAVKRRYGASSDEIASIGRLLTEGWYPSAPMCALADGASMRKPKQQQKPLNDLSRSGLAQPPSLRIPRLLSNLYNIKKCLR
jgi:hypothetical protein